MLIYLKTFQFCIVSSKLLISKFNQIFIEGFYPVCSTAQNLQANRGGLWFSQLIPIHVLLNVWLVFILTREMLALLAFLSILMVQVSKKAWDSFSRTAGARRANFFQILKCDSESNEVLHAHLLAPHSIELSKAPSKTDTWAWKK